MKAEILNIGDELLIGQVVNTNAAWLGSRLSDAGIAVIRMTTVNDQRETILEALAEASRRADVILITGGLGPTNDDITKKVLCEYFDTTLVCNEEALNTITSFFHQRGIELSALNRMQAELPANCTPIENLNGTAPGMWFEKDNCVYVSMPGVPYEMMPMTDNYVLPWLSERNKGSVILHKTILTQGMGESFLSVVIKEWEESLPGHIKLAYLPQPGIVRLRLTGTGNNKEMLQAEIEEKVGRLKAIIPGLIFGYDDDTLEQVVGKLLRDGRKTLATAESCTGGYLAHLITGVPGSSDYYKGSVIAYANEIKERLLDVSASSIEGHGAVSREVAIQMAQGVRTLMGSVYSIALTGIAGPDGGTTEKPVGTTWIAVSGPASTRAEVFQFGEHRQRNIHKAAITALNMLRKMIQSAL